MKYSTYLHPSLLLLTLLAINGCTAISVSPTCPSELQVGDSGPLLANEVNSGAIPTYLWEVIPAEVGRVRDPTMPSTSFEATSEGEAVIRLTASDGLYQVISECQTRVKRLAEAPPDDSGDDDPKDDPPRPGRRVRGELP